MNKPNIVLIFCDDLGYGDLGCYGSKVNRTTRLDRMAREGIRFTDFYVASSVCSPSRAALMTGCYPKRIGLDSGHDFCVLLPGDPIGLHPEEVTIADILKSAGYATKMIGKWHLGDQASFLPTRHGFDSYFGLPYSNDMLPDHPKNDRFHFPPLPLMRGKAVVEIDPNQASLTDRYTAEAVEFMRNSAESDNPFFLYFAHMYVHLPIYAPMKYLEASNNGSYGAAVEHIDQITGVFLDTLSELGIENNTLVIFTSDNGSNGRNGGSNSPLRGIKGSTWEGGMREPCIMRWPGVIPAGSTCREIATAMDLLPSLAHFADREVPNDRIIDGRDIRRLILGEADARSPHEAFFYYGAGDHKLHAVRAGKWKLHLLKNELYDLDSDIAEQHDVFSAHSEVVSRLTNLANECRHELGDANTGTTEGCTCRPAGRVKNPKTLTSMEKLNPYLRALYDLDDVDKNKQDAGEDSPRRTQRHRA